MKIVAIHQPQYLPYLGFFHKLLHCDVFVALDNVQFQKNGLQNRNKVKNAQGWQWLTVPVLHDFGQLINEVRTNPEIPWQQKHWNALRFNYSRAAYFDTYGPALENILNRDWNNLCELNVTLIRWVAEALGIETPIVYSSDLSVDGNKTGLLVEVCQALEADGYLSGPGGRRYMDLAAFEAAGIEVLWQQFIPPVYKQLFPGVGFIPNLSVVDALFNCGPETLESLQPDPCELNPEVAC
jgi:hypothetical protein